MSDVTGAGDTVIAAMALGLAAGGSLEDAARLANRAAGLAVGRFGPVAITAERAPRRFYRRREPAAKFPRVRRPHFDRQIDRLLAIRCGGFLHRHPFDERVGQAAGDLGVVAGLVAPVVREPRVGGAQAAGAAEDEPFDELLGREVAEPAAASAS